MVWGLQLPPELPAKIRVYQGCSVLDIVINIGSIYTLISSGKGEECHEEEALRSGELVVVL